MFFIYIYNDDDDEYKVQNNCIHLKKSFCKILNAFAVIFKQFCPI